jgi:hypothetical protein
MEHLPYRADLAPCDFFLFGAMKENLSGQRFESVEELFFAIEAFLRGLCAGILQTILLEWERRLRICRESGGEYVDTSERLVGTTATRHHFSLTF